MEKKTWKGVCASTIWNTLALTRVWIFLKLHSLVPSVDVLYQLWSQQWLLPKKLRKRWFIFLCLSPHLLMIVVYLGESAKLAWFLKSKYYTNKRLKLLPQARSRLSCGILGTFQFPATGKGLKCQFPRFSWNISQIPLQGERENPCFSAETISPHPLPSLYCSQCTVPTQFASLLSLCRKHSALEVFYILNGKWLCFMHHIVEHHFFFLIRYWPPQHYILKLPNTS